MGRVDTVEVRLGGKAGHALEDVPEAVGVVDILGAVGRQEDEPPRFEPQSVERVALAGCDVDVTLDGIDDGVPGLVDAFGEALVVEVADGALGRREQVVGGVVAQHAVVLLGHPAVEAPQARLDVGQFRVEFAGGNAARQRRVGVAVDQHHVGRNRLQQGFERAHHRAGLLAVAARPDREVVGGFGQVQLLEEDGVELRRVVLAGVDQRERAVPALGLPDQRRELDYLRTGPEDERERRVSVHPHPR